MAVQRGLDERHEQNQQQILRDTRPLGQRFVEGLKTPVAVIILLVGFCISAFLFPEISDVMFVLGVVAFIFNITRRRMLPFRLPKRSGMIDYNDQLPGQKQKFSKARGIYYLGNDRKTKQELWFTNEDMRTHMLIFGSTGSGKTEALISFAYNALVQSSGFIYVDGKGDNSLFARIFSMVRYMGRDDDLLLINFMTGARDIVGPQRKRLSNTMNPFSIGSSSMLAQLVVSLMDKSSSDPSGDMWKGRAIAFVEALMKVLVTMRDMGHILLDANSVRNYFHLDRLEAMVLDKMFIRDNQTPVSLEGLPETVLEPIRNYLLTLPGYNKEKKGKQVSQVLEQHGFITMQLVRVFTSLADTYGHILRTKLAEVDLKDVVLNRRILLVLLPALEKSPDELSNLGKVVIASLKAMMAAGLGDAVEGEYSDLIERKPTNAKTPYLCILDEYGYYAVQGFAVVPAQARSLGFSVIFAGQDLPAFQKASKEEAASIGANTNIKICMKLEDPLETWDFFMKTAGESYVTHVDSFQIPGTSVFNNYQDSKGAKLEKRARVDLLDLKEQREGEMHIFFKSRIVRGMTFYANPVLAKQMRLNHFLKIDMPADTDVNQFKKSLSQFKKLLPERIQQWKQPEKEEEIDQVVQKLNSQPTIVPIVAALSCFAEQADEVNATQVATSAAREQKVPELSSKELSVFTPIRENSYLAGIMLTEPVAEWAAAILNQSQLRDQVEYLQRLCGNTNRQASTVANELINDMRKGTYYPPKMVKKPDIQRVVNSVDQVIQAIEAKKSEKTEKVD